ncbi:GP88 family protein [Singulisphaera sp. PoT]|uniref:GP88 family protein n=1 Tax=Singulisphaera sp. PoT TaxID=3411797 RepID=UPI003BF60283
MEDRIRPLLTLGNGKVGEAIHLWSIPALATCPGRTSVCSRGCYARQGRFLLPAVKERLGWCLEQSKLEEFAPSMIAEIKRRGALVVRVHVAGDFYSAEYAEKWLAVMKGCPRTRFYGYSRSWRIHDIAPVLEEMARLRCCRLWYSLDAETGLPDSVPPGIRLAYMQVNDDRPEQADLVFRVRRLRKESTDGMPVCPQETAKGKSTTCGGCGICWKR